MLDYVINWRLDAAFMALLAFAAMTAVHVFLRRRHAGEGVPLRHWVVLAVLVAVGLGAAEAAGQHEKWRLQRMLQGIAPTYAQEMERMGHAGVSLQTPPENPVYLRMIDAERRWEKAHPHVSDIYTFRRGEGDSVLLVVDAESDYDGSGMFDGEREQRTDIGEIYEETTPNMLRALGGEECFDDFPVTDRWGTWISAFVPLRDESGKVEAVLGVDYDVRSWILSILQVRAGALGMSAVLVAIMISATLLVQVTRAEMHRRMTAEKERDQMRHDLLLVSHKAGMAEIASGVLHNIGNALNSVSVSASLLSEKISAGRAAALGRVADMMRRHEDDLHNFLTQDSKGREIPQYLTQLAEHMQAEQEKMLAEVNDLNRSLDNIKRAVESQQQKARATHVSDIFEMAALLDDVLRMNAPTLEKHEVKVVREYGRCKPVMGDPIRIQQIVTNLIGNARQALMAVDRPRRLRLVLEQSGGDNGEELTRVIVADNGEGIDEASQARLFMHGFTTRSDGHGFGLHWSAITAKQLGGELRASSEGRGKGAAFTLEIPTTMKEVLV